MKKACIFFCLALTLLFVGFVAGMMVGRHTSGGAVSIQIPPASAFHAATFQQGSQSTAIGSTQETEFQPININTASAQDLDTLPGIGQVLAQRIVDYREANGNFESVADLSKVDGIGDAKLLQLLGLITTGG